jgi:hypothetical protein
MGGKSRTDQAADELYAASADAFIERRRDLARLLREAGDAEGAGHVAALPKPSISAWAVNQLWWSHREAFEGLFAAAKALRDAPAARRAFEAKLRVLRDRARDTLATAGHTASVALLRRVTTSLHALAVNGSFAPDAAGRLVHDREPPGFEAIEGAIWSDGDGETADAPPKHQAVAHGPAKVAPTKVDARRAKLEAQRVTLEAERAKANAQHARLVADRAKIDAQYTSLGAERARLEAERARLEAERMTLDALRTKLDTERTRLAAQKQGVESAMARAAEESARHAARIVEIERSLGSAGDRSKRAGS